MISASIEQPSPAGGLGYWPKFFTLGAGYRTDPGSWPSVGETDIMEDVNARSESSETLHCGTAPGGNCDEYNGLTSGLSTCSGCQTGYHTYSEIIDRTTSDEQIRFYIDGHQVWTVKESQVGAATWQAAIDHGFSIVLDLAIGGSYPNTVCGCTSPSAQTSSGGTLSIGSLEVEQATRHGAPAVLGAHGALRAERGEGDRRRPGQLRAFGQRRAVSDEGRHLGAVERRGLRLHAGPAVHGRQHHSDLGHGRDDATPPRRGGAVRH